MEKYSNVPANLLTNVTSDGEFIQAIRFTWEKAGPGTIQTYRSQYKEPSPQTITEEIRHIVADNLDGYADQLIYDNWQTRSQTEKDRLLKIALTDSEILKELQAVR